MMKDLCINTVKEECYQWQIVVKIQMVLNSS